MTETARRELPANEVPPAVPAGVPVATALPPDGELPPGTPLPVLVTRAVRLVGAFWWSAAHGTGLTPAGLGVLRQLTATDGLKPSEVAAQGLWAPGTITSVVDTLVRDGFVERRRDDGDRRVVRLHLTDAGRAKAAEVFRLVGPKWQDAFGYLDPADEPAVRRFLEQTIARLTVAVREERGR
jgi:DNA-binding MarR family transcriptional regulator